MTASKISRTELTQRFPTDHLPSEFWESLGRVVATYGFLEQVLGKAIFAFTATREFSNQQDLDKAYEVWFNQLERALTDQLGALINSYESSVRIHQEAPALELARLFDELRDAARTRNVLCHGAWGPPDLAGASVPYFVSKQGIKYDTAISRDALDGLREHVSMLACDVIDSVTCMGWRFPGLPGPGRPLW